MHTVTDTTRYFGQTDFANKNDACPIHGEMLYIFHNNGYVQLDTGFAINIRYFGNYRALITCEEEGFFFVCFFFIRFLF